MTTSPNDRRFARILYTCASRKALAITLTRVPASSCSWISSRATLVSFEGIATPRKTLNTTGKCRDRRLEGKDTLNMLHIDKNNDLHTKNGCRALEQAMFDILRVRGGPGSVFIRIQQTFKYYDKKKCDKRENGSFSGRKTSPFGLGVYVCSIHILHL